METEPSLVALGQQCSAYNNNVCPVSELMARPFFHVFIFYFYLSSF